MSYVIAVHVPDWSAQKHEVVFRDRFLRDAGCTLEKHKKEATSFDTREDAKKFALKQGYKTNDFRVLEVKDDKDLD